MEIVIQLLWAVTPSLLVGVALAAFNRRQARRTEQEKQQQRDKFDTDLMRIDLEVAAAQLAYAVAMAYKRGTPNGEMEDAIGQYEKAMVEFRKFERMQIAKNNTE